MTTFKHGDRVTCEIAGTKITDARISISNPLLISGSKVPFICQNFKSGVSATEKFGYEHSWKLDNNFYEQDVTNLRLVEKTIDDIEVGDKIVDPEGDGSTFEVIFRSGELVVCKHNYLGKWRATTNYIISELKGYGWILEKETDKEPIKMTVAEIAKKLGHEVEIIK